MTHDELIVNFEVYEDGSNLLGIAQCTLPNIQFMTQNIQGAGIGGTIDAVAQGMVNAMSFTMNFRSATGDAVKVFTPGAHQLTLMACEQGWDASRVTKVMKSDKFVITADPKNFNFGNLAPASVPDASNEYSVKYFAGYRDGKQLFEIDPINMKCVVGGVDYMADVRKAVGK